MGKQHAIFHIKIFSQKSANFKHIATKKQVIYTPLAYGSFLTPYKGHAKVCLLQLLKIFYYITILDKDTFSTGMVPMGKVVAVCISEKKGTQKRDVGIRRLIEHFGVEGDAHAGKWHRQVSLLARESADVMRQKGLNIKDGDFGENIVTEGIELKSVPVGTILKIGAEAILRITQIGKLCHDRCAIYYKAGDCIMPREGIFAEILSGGIIKVGDEITIQEKDVPVKI